MITFVPRMRGWFNTFKSIEKKKEILSSEILIISIDAERAFGKAQYPFIIKALKKLGIEEVQPQCNKCYI